jgi:3-methylfumaryl-CoA hydratase
MAADSIRTLEQLEPGTELAAAVRTPTSMEVFLYSAAVWLPHRVHYDHPYTTETEGHKDLLVQGPLQGIYLEQLVRGAIGPGWELESFRYRHRAPAYVNEPLTCRARVTAVGGDRVTFEVASETADGTVTTTGELALARRAP